MWFVIKSLIKYKSLKTSPENSFKTNTNEAENNGLDREIPKEDIYLKKKRQTITDDLRLK